MQLAIDFDAPPRFSGSDYDHARDSKRLGAQLKRILNYMASGDWHSLREIAEATGAPEASVSAQLRNARKERFGSHVIEKRNRGEREHGLFEYKLQVTSEPT
jgi:hypothetical protein